ncbi:YjbF family lipoprotein [Hydrocarboniphaga sp.]|uniref:YjbF family lipoprotein n=1 Tax=Hydrocarboniphaga sp. TaxID=2033016 RepID=UPI003D0B616C
MEFTRTPALTRRKLLAAAAAAVASGCSQTPTLQLVKDSFSLVGPQGSAYPRTREQVDALPYAQLGVRIGSGARGIMVLAEKNGDDLQWLSANRIMLLTRRGRIVRTVGLPTDLSGCALYGPDLLEQYNFEAPAAPASVLRRSIDIGSAFGIPVQSKFTIEGEETITILDQKIDSLRIREDLDSSDRKWRKPNRYWLSKRSALIWRSLQYVTPNDAPLELEILKRPA